MHLPGKALNLLLAQRTRPMPCCSRNQPSLYKQYNLRRAYYSAFSPIPHADPSLPLKKIPLVREHRLYQADWLMRFYGFTAR